MPSSCRPWATAAATFSVLPNIDSNTTRARSVMVPPRMRYGRCDHSRRCGSTAGGAEVVAPGVLGPVRWIPSPRETAGERQEAETHEDRRGPGWQCTAAAGNGADHGPPAGGGPGRQRRARGRGGRARARHHPRERTPGRPPCHAGSRVRPRHGRHPRRPRRRECRHGRLRHRAGGRQPAPAGTRSRHRAHDDAGRAPRPGLRGTDQVRRAGLRLRAGPPPGAVPRLGASVRTGPGTAAWCRLRLPSRSSRSSRSASSWTWATS